MNYMASIDIGGTFTDGFFSKDGEVKRVKVDTTPHDFTACFLDCFEAAAKLFNLSLHDMLKQMQVVRFSSTIGTNTLITKSGSKVGLIATKGSEQNLYAEDQGGQSLNSILDANMVYGINEKIDDEGISIKPPEEKEVRLAARRLLELGSRVIVVSLHGSFLNSAHERQVKELIGRDYPRHYLGAVPVLLSSDVTGVADDALKTNTAVLNAYLHRTMSRFLYRAEEELLKKGCRRPLLIVHGRSGASRVSKVVAIQTLASGPAAGLAGAAFMSQLYDLPKVVTIDIGGTSMDLGLVRDGVYHLNYRPKVEGIGISVPLADLVSIGGGGGSIAKAKPETGDVQVGPESTGAIPGPACYDLGGTSATVTDACLILGYIDPDYFCGGRRKLNYDKARQSIEEEVAKPLGISAEEAGLKIVRAVESIGAQNIEAMLSASGTNNGDAVLFSFGGAGGMFSPFIASRQGIDKVYCFTFSPIFGAFGLSTTDISHYYEAPSRIPLRSASLQYLSHFEEFNGVVDRLMDIGYRDLKGEGLPVEKATTALELELTGKNGWTTAQSPKTRLKGEADVRDICNTYQADEGEVITELFRVGVTCPVSHYQVPSHQAGGKSPKKAYRGKRPVYWPDGHKESGIYEQGLLEYGNEVEGPAVIESEYDTVLVPSGRKYTVNKYLNGIIDKV